MRRLIFDCDNTFGIPGCDVDDALALFYLLGCGQASVLGITTTHGNSQVNQVYPNTLKLLAAIGRSDIPVFRGKERDEPGENDAAVFLAAQARQNPGSVWVLATGSMTNLKAAYGLDPNFFRNLAGISLMGGITAPLHINGTILGELNLSCDAPAALCVLQNGKNRLISTGNACMTAFFPREQAEKRLGRGGETGAWLMRGISYWFQREREVFGHDGIYQWDVCAAAALMEPEWFDWQETVISPTVDSLRSGNLIGGGTAVTVRIPSVKNESAFTEHIYDVYLKNEFKGEDLQNET